MPFDGSGNFSRLYNWQSDRDNAIKILASRMDGEFDNFAAGMNVVFFRSGMVPMSGNLQMGSNNITGLGSGSEGSPAIKFADDPNTGVFLNGLSTLQVVTNGVTRVGVTNAGMAVTGNLSISGNLAVTGTTGFTGNVTFGTATATKFEIDATSNWTMSAGNPYLTFDAGDYIAYDRTGNSHNFAIGGVGIASIDAAGFDVSGAVAVSGAVTALSHSLDTHGHFSMSGSNPILSFDNNDYLYYDRAGNAFNFAIGAGTQLTMSPGAAFFAGVVQAPTVRAEVSYYMAMLDATTTLLNFDSNDYMTYNRSLNTFGCYIGGSLTHHWNASAPYFGGQAIAFDGMSRGSCRLYDSTGAPSGGSNGDFWFQYA